ncbi:hypothetical protein ACFX1S_037939 [Malus domestica]
MATKRAHPPPADTNHHPYAPSSRLPDSNNLAGNFPWQLVKNGTRNLKQEVTSWATMRSMDEEWDLGPSRESRSE